MKEWLIKMAKELGLPDGATEEQVLAKLSERLLSGGTAESRLASVASQLSAVGCKLENDKIVKLESKPASPDPVRDAKIAELELENAKSKLSSARATVDGFIAAGKVPPALKAHLDRVFASTGKLESIALGKGSDNSEVVIKGTIDVLEDLRALFNGMPSIVGSRMSTVGGTPDPKGNGAKPGELGRAVAERNKIQKKEPAAK